MWYHRDSGAMATTHGYLHDDATLEWAEQGILHLSEFIQICEVLDIRSSAKQNVRTLRTKLVNRRRALLDVVDAAALPLLNIFPQMNGSPSVTNSSFTHQDRQTLFRDSRHKEEQ